MKLKRKSRDNWNKWELPKEVTAAIRKEFRRSSKRYGAAFLVLVIVVSYGFWDASQARLVACRHENDTRKVIISVVDRLISNRKGLYSRKEISSHQYEHEIEAFIYAKTQLQERNCKRELFVSHA